MSESTQIEKQINALQAKINQLKQKQKQNENRLKLKLANEVLKLASEGYLQRLNLTINDEVLKLIERLRN